VLGRAADRADSHALVRLKLMPFVILYRHVPRMSALGKPRDLFITSTLAIVFAVRSQTQPQDQSSQLPKPGFQSCICALPVTILQSIPNDFAPRVQRAIEATTYTDNYKIAWESKRFWETDFNIYVGISWLTGGPVVSQRAALQRVRCHAVALWTRTLR
jgi:hypothetical protein